MPETCCHHQTCLPSLAMQFVFPWSDLLVMDLHRKHAETSVQAALYSIQITCMTGQLQSGHSRRACLSKSKIAFERHTTSILLSERSECLTMRLTPHDARNVLPSSNMSAITRHALCVSMVRPPRHGSSSSTCTKFSSGSSL